LRTMRTLSPITISITATKDKIRAKTSIKYLRQETSLIVCKVFASAKRIYCIKKTRGPVSIKESGWGLERDGHR
jgi:hypothetical protein